MNAQRQMGRTTTAGVRLVVAERPAGGQRIAVRVCPEAVGIEQIELAVTVPGRLSSERLAALGEGLAEVLRRTGEAGMPWSGLATTLLQGCTVAPDEPQAAGLGGRLPADELARLRDVARRQGYAGEPCTVCGQFALVRTGSCHTCLHCYAPGGCG